MTLAGGGQRVRISLKGNCDLRATALCSSDRSGPGICSGTLRDAGSTSWRPTDQPGTERPRPRRADACAADAADLAKDRPLAARVRELAVAAPQVAVLLVGPRANPELAAATGASGSIPNLSATAQTMKIVRRSLARLASAATPLSQLSP
jgi:hypothetical protein